MRALRAIGKIFWRFMVIFSFIVNVILVAVLLVLLLLIFDIKNNIAQPLVEGLHSSFVGLNDSTIDWSIPVDDQITINGLQVPINANTIVSPVFEINGQPVTPIQGETVVSLTRDVPLNVSGARITAGPLTLDPANVQLTLPAGTQLPVALNLVVAINNAPVPVDLNVRAVIPLSQTQLHDPVENLRLLFEPLVRVLGNLPGNFSEVGPFASQLLSGNPPNLLADTPYSLNPWPGYSITAGQNYNLASYPIPAENVPTLTGIYPIGGIPALDEALRPELYAGDLNPMAVNQSAAGNMQAQGVPPQYYDGTYGDDVLSPRRQAEGILVTPGEPLLTPQPTLDTTPVDTFATPIPDQPALPTATPSGDLGIIPPGSG